MENSPCRGAWRCTRHRKSCCRSSDVGAPNETTCTPRGLRQPATCLMVPSFPAVSRPCSTTITLFTFAPHSASCSSNSSSPSAAKRARAFSLWMPFGGSVGILSSETRSPRLRNSVRAMRGLVFLRQRLSRKQRFVEAEAREVLDAHRVEHAVEVVHFVLHHAGVETFHLAPERLSVLVDPFVAQPAPA